MPTQTPPPSAAPTVTDTMPSFMDIDWNQTDPLTQTHPNSGEYVNLVDFALALLAACKWAFNQRLVDGVDDAHIKSADEINNHLFKMLCWMPQYGQCFIRKPEKVDQTPTLYIHTGAAERALTISSSENVMNARTERTIMEFKERILPVKHYDEQTLIRMGCEIADEGLESLKPIIKEIFDKDIWPKVIGKEQKRGIGFSFRQPKYPSQHPPTP